LYINCPISLFVEVAYNCKDCNYSGADVFAFLASVPDHSLSCYIFCSLFPATVQVCGWPGAIHLCSWQGVQVL